MRIISRHLLGELLGATLLGSVLLGALVFLLQALRLGHHLAGSGAGLSLLGGALALSSPSLLVFSLPLAAPGAVLLVWGRLADTRQLLALRVAGASPLQLARPVLELLLLAGLMTIALGRWVEPAAIRRLQGRLTREAMAAWLGGLRPRQFQALPPGVTLYAEASQPGARAGELQIEGLFLAREVPPQQLLAGSAILRADDDASLELELQGGELRAAGGDGALERVHFGRAHLSLDLGDALRPHLGFLARRAAEAPARALLAATGGLALGLLALLVGSRAARPWWRGLLGLLALGGQQGGLLLLGALGAGTAGALLFSLGLAALAALLLALWTGP